MSARLPLSPCKRNPSCLTSPTARLPATCPRHRQVPLSEEEQAAAAAKPDKFAIGVEGGFNVDAKKYRVETDWVR